jgi:hypothetical protein
MILMNISIVLFGRFHLKSYLLKLTIKQYTNSYSPASLKRSPKVLRRRSASFSFKTTENRDRNNENAPQFAKPGVLARMQSALSRKVCFCFY